MLEVRNLKKIYKTKNGAAVNALDGVSLQFPETGMVFLLGKSGSGKSTLLNVCGGLDNPTEGEIIVKGRSSQDFSQSDFDSYRNTFIGFIFQEYNILNEFSVEDNIALALELQGKPKDKAAIAALLEEVDLSGYAKRKPNTLSGGQKQRIAIARALIKKPEIIMADEPTGALDSNTGKQVFDTLKKLSRDKLVIVVSHDRDFAEQYGDRIIELKDGQILSDVSKTHAASTEISANVNRVGDVLCIKKGADLSENDFANIKKFLKDSDSDVVIASDNKAVKAFKTVAKINDAGEMEVFKKTDQDTLSKKEYTKEDSRFIRSKLPARHAFKIGVSGLRQKPIRLFFTIILCSIAFVLFGLLSTLNFYDSETTFKQTLIDLHQPTLQLNKEYQATITWYTQGQKDHSFNTVYPTAFSPDELKTLSADIDADAFGAIRQYSSFNLRQVESKYWTNAIAAAAVLPEGNTLRERIDGAYPKSKDELVISSYFADMLKACKVLDNTGTAITLDAATDIIGKKIVINGYTYTVTGILDSGAIPEDYAPLKEEFTEDKAQLLNKFTTHLESGLHQLIFITQERAEELTDDYMEYKESKDQYMRIAYGTKENGEYSIPEHANGRYNAVTTLSKENTLFSVTKDGTALADNEAVVSARVLGELIGRTYNTLAENAQEREQFSQAEQYNKLAQIAWDISMGGTYEQVEQKKEAVLKPFSDSVFSSKLQTLISAVKRDKLDLSVALQLFDDSNQSYIGEKTVCQIVAIYRPQEQYGEEILYLSDNAATALWDTQKAVIPSYSDMQTAFVEAPDALYSVIYLPGEIPAEKLDMYWDLYSNEQFDENSARIMMTGGFVSSLRNVDYMIKELSSIFLYVGLVLAVFSALLLSNFISVSISNKKREIGILRAVGARSTDVFKIFFSESFVIGAICVALSTVASVLLCSVINAEGAAELGASLFVFGIPSFAVLIGIALLTILVATFLPVYNAAKKKPVDSIRSL